MKTKDTFVRARIDSDLKRESEAILDELGLTTTEAIRLFLVQVRRQRGLPFAVTLLHPDDADDLLLPNPMRQAALDVLDDD